MKGNMSNKIYHIQATLEYNEDDEHIIETVYYIHLKLVLSDVCNLNKYENLYITEMMFISYKYLSYAVEVVCTS